MCFTGWLWMVSFVVLEVAASATHAPGLQRLTMWVYERRALVTVVVIACEVMITLFAPTPYAMQGRVIALLALLQLPLIGLIVKRPASGF